MLLANLTEQVCQMARDAGSNNEEGSAVVTVYERLTGVKVAAAWGELRDWIAATGHTTRAGFWECYTIGPESSTDPADWRTELTWPLAEETPITTR